jgi:hypothetical protein
MKLSSITRQYVAKILGGNFDRIEYLPTDGTKGGILLGWQASCIDVFHPMLKVFSLSIEIKKWLAQSFLLTTVYGPTKDDVKPSFLDELWSLKLASLTPWMVLGDFNFIYEAKDKINLNLKHKLMGCFRHTLDTCELFEFAL